jgi:hypothetical protein
MMVVVVARRSHMVAMAPLFSKKECGGCWNAYDAGRRGRNASLLPCVAAVYPLSMVGDARPDVARQSTAMVPSRSNGPSVGC